MIPASLLAGVFQALLAGIGALLVAIAVILLIFWILSFLAPP